VRRQARRASGIQDELDLRVRSRTAELAEANRSLYGEIDRRKMIEAELRLQSAHLSEAQRFANLGSWSGTSRAHGHLVGPALGSMVCSPASSAAPSNISSVCCTKTIANASVRDHQAYQTGQPFRLEERIMRPDGEIRQLECSGEVIRDDRGNAVRMLGICQDVTEQKQTATSLRNIENQYRLMIESVQDYASTCRSRSNISSWTPRAADQAICGGRSLGSHFGRFYIDDDREAGCRSVRCGSPSTKAIRGRGLARAPGRHAFLGERRHRSDP